jgi:hypothetical protein
LVQYTSENTILTSSVRELEGQINTLTVALAETKAVFIRAQIEYKDNLEEYTSLLEFKDLELELKNKNHDGNHGKGQEMVVSEDENSFDSVYNSEVKTSRSSKERMITNAKPFTNPLLFTRV